MARGRASTFDASRDEILLAAARLFAAQGFSATSMNQVAEACAVSKATLYHYVKDKQELLLQICESHVLELKALVAQVLSQGLASEPRLRALITAFVRAYGQSQDQHRVLTEDMRFLAPADQTRLRAIEREVVLAFAQALAELRPELTQDKLHKATTMLLFGMINWTFTWLRPDGQLSYDAIAPMVADLFFGGIHAVHPPSESQT